MKRLALLITVAAALSACASPEARLRAGLTKAGLSDHMAGCMAPYMTDRLSIGQLRKLQSLAGVAKADYHRMTVDDYLRQVRALEDVELLMVTGKAALRCAI